MISTNVEALADMQRVHPGTLGRVVFWEQGKFGGLSAGIVVTVRAHDTGEEVDIYYAGDGCISLMCNNSGTQSHFCVYDEEYRGMKNAEILPAMYRRCPLEQEA